jgi:hypothetical protein
MNNNNLLTNLIGVDGIKFSISVDLASVAYLVGGALLAGVLLIVISKKMIR